VKELDGQDLAAADMVTPVPVDWWSWRRWQWWMLQTHKNWFLCENCFRNLQTTNDRVIHNVGLER